MSGAGNDFVLVDNRTGRYTLRWQEAAPALCDRRNGIGADGLLVLEASPSAAFRMLYFNADGSFGGMCGNGGRCVADFVMRTDGLASVRFEALNSLYTAARSHLGVKLQMKDPTSFRIGHTLQIGPVSLEYSFVDTGAPHVVLFLEEMPPALRSAFLSQGISDIGRTLRYHPEFAPGGTNVNVVSHAEEGGTLEMRTYERGVEAETLACGTGAVACSVIVALRSGKRPPIAIRTRGGEDLRVDFLREGDRIRRVELEGSARRIFAGEAVYEEGRGLHA